VDVNVLGTIYCAQAALPALREREESRIVNIASTAGARGSPTDPTYGASKGGVIGFTKSLAKHYTDDGVFTNAVAPGPTDTSMFREERREGVREASPIGRLVTPEEVAATIRFFATTTSVSGPVSPAVVPGAVAVSVSLGVSVSVCSAEQPARPATPAAPAVVMKVRRLITE
jgi:NAD(P)-dependent dehydrogenase (short-subunit alcohol dehydrogenase family)